MALITCSECKREISDQATVCPGCGVHIEKNINKRAQATLEKVILKILPVAIFIIVIIFLESVSKPIFRIFGL